MIKVASFDVFDTLIGRAHGHPDSIFDRVERETKFNDFKNLRKKAESQSDGTWNSIWEQFTKITNEKPHVVNFLKEKEWNIELEETFPIVPICKQVKSNDIFVSDMYITVEMMQQLLEKNGLGKVDKNKIFVSPGGKSQGWIWDTVKQKGYQVTDHIGDNLHSDVQTPKTKGIQTHHYQASQYTTKELDLIKISMFDLANLSRMLRLSNSQVEDVKFNLWNEFVSTNIPFLVMGAHGVYSKMKEKNIKRVLFATRDCCFLQKVFQKLYPDVEAHTFYASRVLYFHPTIDYIQYASKLIDNDTLIVDIHGTAHSLTEFIKGALKTKPHIMMMSISGNGQYIKNYGKGYYFVDGIGDNIERLNVDLVGTYFDFVGNQAISQHNELDESKVKVLHQCFQLAMIFMDKHFYSLKDNKIYGWSNESTKWCLSHFHPNVAKSAFVWEPTHFYAVCDLDHRRNEYRQKLKLGTYKDAKCPKVVEENKTNNHIVKIHLPVIAPKFDSSKIEYKSQIGQDKYYVENVINYGINGFFLDIGAHNGVNLSNTFVLEKNLGWKGICIEANPFVFEDLKKNRSSICVNQCLWSKETMLELEFPKSNEIPEGNDMLVRISGLEGNDNYFSSQFQKKDKHKVKTTTLEKVLDLNNCPLIIDYMSIDIEGAELEVLKVFNFAKYHINFITIEHGYRNDYKLKIREFLKLKGFKLHRENQFDDEFENEIQKVTYSSNSVIPIKSANIVHPILNFSQFVKLRSIHK